MRLLTRTGEVICRHLEFYTGVFLCPVMDDSDSFFTFLSLNIRSKFQTDLQNVKPGKRVEPEAPGPVCCRSAQSTN